MLFSYSFILLIGATSILAKRQCGAVISDEARTAAYTNVQAHKKTTKGDKHGPIEIIWHVISKDETPANGNIPYEQLERQMHVLNKSYEPSGVKFTLTGVNRVINASWFDAAPDSFEEADMKRSLRQGSVDTLNVYSVNFTLCSCGGIPLTGSSTFPSQYANNPLLDGVIVLFSSLPGGITAPFNLGKTLVHESGHWLGALHPFTGFSCTGPGDFVDDTPAELFSTDGCPEGKDTCPDAPGLDPIHNYMDFSDDACMNNFTPGQVARFKEQMLTFRGVNL